MQSALHSATGRKRMVHQKRRKPQLLLPTKQMDLAVLNAENAAPNQKGIQVTERALKRIRVAMAKEGVSPEQGGLRLGIQGGGCSGLSYNIRFDSQPRERDRVYNFE